MPSLSLSIRLLLESRSLIADGTSRRGPRRSYRKRRAKVRRSSVRERIPKLLDERQRQREREREREREGKEARKRREEERDSRRIRVGGV